jgi:ribosomal protein L37AE/L43A
LISTPNNSHHASSPTTAVTPSQAEYARYLESARWRNLALAVRLRAKNKCEICRRADGVECAHLTYDRIFHEPIDDLLWLCRKCHRELDQNR